MPLPPEIQGEFLLELYEVQDIPATPSRLIHVFSRVGLPVGLGHKTSVRVRGRVKGPDPLREIEAYADELEIIDIPHGCR
jgi:hypothetical protein